MNLPGLRDPKALEQFELEKTSARSRDLLPSGRLDADHYQAIHKYLFQDVYEWAGQLRTVSISKGASPFCEPRFIQEQLAQLFSRLEQQDFLRQLDPTSFAIRAAEFLADLNAIHAFREGNGRTQLAFLTLLASEAGHPFDHSRMVEAEFLQAMIQSFDGNNAPLEAQLLKLIV